MNSKGRLKNDFQTASGFVPAAKPYSSVRFKSNLASSEILFSVMDGVAAADRQPAKRLFGKIRNKMGRIRAVTGSF